VKLWLTASELAALALPGLPGTDRGVRDLAEREGWAGFSGLCRARAGRGGGVEYHLSLLPAGARLAYLAPAASGLAEAGACAVQAAPDLAPGTASAAGLAMDARIAVLGSMRAFQRAADLKQTVAVGHFVDLYNLGKADVPPFVREQLPRLSTRTVLRWLAAAQEGVQRLAVDRGAARRGKGALEAGAGGRVKAYTLALIVQNPLYTALQIHEALQGEFGDHVEVDGEQVALPGKRALEIALKRWRAEHHTELLALTNPDAFVSKVRPSGSYDDATRLNQLWQIDASPADALCTDGRYSVYLCIDVWSRRLIIYVSKTPRSEAVQLLMRKAIAAWGVPEAVKTDNGSDFVARATRRLFQALGIEPITSQAFSPWQKGIIERAVRTFQTDCARTLPGFIGHSVADRKVIEQRKAFAARLGTDDDKAFAVALGSQELQQIVDRWAAELYGMREHGTIKMSPFARAASWSGPIRQADEQALAVLLMQAPDAEGYRTVGKRGIRIDGYHYLAPGLLVGERVFVTLDPADKGKIWCWTDENRDTSRGVATCPELSGVDPVALLHEVKAAQKRLIAERSEEIKAERRKITSRTVMDARFKLAEQRAGNLVAFPQRVEAHSTPALDAGAEVAALRRGEAPPAAPLSEAAAKVHRELLEAPATAPAEPKITKLRPQETARQRFRRALGIEAAIAAGDQVATEDALWLGSYRTSAEYRSEKALAEDFGEAALR
jgi:putative transposase